MKRRRVVCDSAAKDTALATPGIPGNSGTKPAWPASNGVQLAMHKRIRPGDFVYGLQAQRDCGADVTCTARPLTLAGSQAHA
jgi:hypothetical protein